MKRIAVALAVLLLLAGGAYWALDPAGGPDGPSAPEDPTDVPPAPTPDGEPVVEPADDVTSASEKEWPPDDVAEVRVVDANGNPVAGARVFLLREGLVNDGMSPEICGESLTGADGCARLHVVPGQWMMLRVEHPDYAPTGDVEAFGGNRAEVVLTQGGTLVGVVTDGESGRPVGGATVVGLDWCLVGDVTLWRATTDEAGSYRMERVAPGRLNVSAFGPEHVRQSLDDAPLIRAGEETRQNIVLEPGVRVTLRVLDGDTGRPVPWVELVLGGRDPTVGPGDALLTPPLPRRGPAPILVRAEGRQSTLQILADLGARERPQDPIEVQLDRGLPVRGRLLSRRGEPVSGVKIHLFLFDRQAMASSQETVRTGADGAFTGMCGIPEGYASLSFRRPDGVMRRVSPRPFASEAGEVRLEPIVFDAGVTLSGTLQDDDGRPVRRAYLTAEPSGDADTGTTASCFVDPRGRFRLGGVPVGEIELRLGAIEGRPPTEQVRTVSGDEEFVWRLPAGFEITGRVVTGEGRPRAGVRVEVEPCGAFLKTGPDGAFRFRGLPAGPHRVFLAEEPDSGRDDVPGDTFDIEIVSRR